jgi:hypothetical protein
MKSLTLAIAAVSTLIALSTPSRSNETVPPVVGRWDLTVHGAVGEYPSWLEVTENGGRLSGRFVGQAGSARPVKQVTFSNGALRVSVAPQYEDRKSDLHFEGRLESDRLEGRTEDGHGREMRWEGTRAPSLKREQIPEWGKALTLFNGRDLAGWHPRRGQGSNWAARGGELANGMAGSDLVTDRTFTDFKIHAEYRYPTGSNSGIYLRGRYEFQIDDDFGKPVTPESSGGIYGFLAPRVSAVRRAGEWEACDVTLIGRMVSATLNGENVLENQEIPGITGDALDSHEGAPGPIMLQGSEGPVTFRNLTIIPARTGNAGGD